MCLWRKCLIYQSNTPPSQFRKICFPVKKGNSLLIKLYTYHRGLMTQYSVQRKQPLAVESKASWIFRVHAPDVAIQEQCKELKTLSDNLSSQIFWTLLVHARSFITLPFRGGLLKAFWVSNKHKDLLWITLHQSWKAQTTGEGGWAWPLNYPSSSSALPLTG